MRDRDLPLLSIGDPTPLLTEGEGSTAHEGGEFRETLFSKAFLVVPGPQYNRVSFEMRGEGPVSKVTFYEVILHEEAGWRILREKTYPSLARYLKAKYINPHAQAGVVVSLFFEDYFYLIEAAQFMQAYREIEKIDALAFHRLVREWLSV